MEDWFRSTTARTGDGQWGVAIGTMDGRVLWSMNPHQELIPASTAKVFTVGILPRSRGRRSAHCYPGNWPRGAGLGHRSAGGEAGSWSWVANPTLERSGRAGPTLRALAGQLRGRGISVLEGPLVLTSTDRAGFVQAIPPSGPPISQVS